MSIGFLILTALAVVLFLLALIIPLMRRTEERAMEGAVAAQLRQRLQEIEQNKSLDLLTEETAEEAVLEAKRAALRKEAFPHARADSKLLRMAAILFVGLTPLAVGVLYFQIGSPGVTFQEAAPAGADIAAMAPEDRSAMIENMVTGLEARLADDPNDIDGWRMLARSQSVLGKFEASAESYERLLSLIDGDENDWRNLAGALISAQPKGVFPSDDRFLAALDEIEKRSPGDAFARFYRGGALRERGDGSGAAAVWRALLDDLPEDAPIRDVLTQLIERADNAADVTVPSSVPE